MARLRPAVIARLYLGMVFLVGAGGKLIQPVDFTGPMSGFLKQVTLRQGYVWYAPIVERVVLPHARVFSILILVAESAIALGMLFGLMTRAAALVAIFLLFNYASAKGAPFWSPGSNDAADIVLCLVVLLGDGGRTWGIDASLHKRFPRIPFW
jgi:uncharacterized membrane protein YphA (DoxX/SURF4 family)